MLTVARKVAGEDKVAEVAARPATKRHSKGVTEAVGRGRSSARPKLKRFFQGGRRALSAEN